MKKLTLIKLGGSVITNKEVPMVVRETVLNRLVQEIKKAQASLPKDELLIVGHGQGSFAHAPAMRYKTMDGFIDDESVIGMAITQDSAAQLNRIVVKSFIDATVPAASFVFSNSMVTKQNKAKHWCSEVLKEYLKKGLLPITGGDVIVDAKNGCTIWSTEKVLGHIATEFNKESEFKVTRIIHVAEVPGVLDSEGKVILEISDDNKAEVKKAITATKGFDVTGGMWHKIEESLLLAEQGVSACIISGLQKNALYTTLVENSCPGTIIKK